MGKNYSFNKVREILAQHEGNIQYAELGMSEDWNWTAESIWEDGKCTLPEEDNGAIAGIGGSSWATPVLKVTFLNGDEEVFDAWVDNNIKVASEVIAQQKAFAGATGGLDNVNGG